MSSALANRFIHVLNFDVDVDDWNKWAIDNDIDVRVRTFVQWQRKLLFAFDPRSNDKAFPTPRSWEFVSDILKTDPDKEVEHELICGCVGEGAAAEFVGFLRIHRDLVSPKAILMAPEKADVPPADRPDVMYALCGSLAMQANAKNMDAIVTYGKRLPKEFNTVLIRDAVAHNAEVQETGAYCNWAAENPKVVM
jgi:hypothetical protein